MLPKDPIILLSYINTQLRDRGLSLEEYAAEEGLDAQALREKLESAGFRYDPGERRFR